MQEPTSFASPLDVIASSFSPTILRFFIHFKRSMEATAKSKTSHRHRHLGGGTVPEKKHQQNRTQREEKRQLNNK